MCKDVTYFLIFLIVLKKSVMFTIGKLSNVDLISSKNIIIGHSRVLDEKTSSVYDCTVGDVEYVAAILLLS